MRNRLLITYPSVIFLVSLMAPSSQAGNWQELVSAKASAGAGFAVWPTTDNQEVPDIYGNIVVWQQLVSNYGDHDIYVADINNMTDPLLSVIGDANDQTNPAIYDNIIVWQDYVVWQGSGDWDIRAVNISDRANPQLFAVSDIAGIDEQVPVIAGNTVVWQDNNVDPPQRIDIYGVDITDPGNSLEFPIAGFEHDQQNPAIYRTTVVWQDNFLGDWDIFAADIWQRNKPVEFPVSLVEKDQQNPAISGNIVVWQDNFTGSWDIYAADISDLNNPVEFAITLNDSSQTNPDIDDNIVVWQDLRNNNWDIFGYNLTTREEFQITDDPADQINPAISGNVVVWQDNRSRNWNIYAAVLDGPQAAKCASRITGDVNGDCKVDFTDLTLMVAHWLECNLEPNEVCWQ